MKLVFKKKNGKELKRKVCTACLAKDVKYFINISPKYFIFGWALLINDYLDSK